MDRKTYRLGLSVFLCCAALLLIAERGRAQTLPANGSPVLLPRATYRDRLVGMWLGQCIANWTGLQTEGGQRFAPFLTDADWDTVVDGRRIYYVFQSPWGSDDDTDIEYIYLETMAELGTARLGAEDVRDAWLDHTVPGQYIWVSNLVAQQLMFGYPVVLPPSTSLAGANDQSRMIDAQLTTELFGALVPGRPGLALTLADLPIRTTASSYAAHAAQFHVALYSLANAGNVMAPRERILWMVQSARRLIPTESKSAAVIDFVLADYLANPDRNNWERTRDAVAQRFQVNAGAYGYAYLEWYEASVNLATGLIALLYGEGDYARTVRIGTLSGWDSDNGTATMGGLLGLMYGSQYVRNAFPGVSLSTQYDIGRTRVGFSPEIVAMTTIADRLLLSLDAMLRELGLERADGNISAWSPGLVDLDAATQNPLSREHASSFNNASGALPSASVAGGTSAPSSAPVASLADGIETDYSGRDRRLPARNQAQFPGQAPTPVCLRRDVAGQSSLTFTVTWSRTARLTGARLVEGASAGQAGGSLALSGVDARIGGVWTPVTLSTPYDPRPDLAFQVHTLAFTTPVVADGLRVRGSALGSHATVCELDGIVDTTFSPIASVGLPAWSNGALAALLLCGALAWLRTRPAVRGARGAAARRTS